MTNLGRGKRPPTCPVRRVFPVQRLLFLYEVSFQRVVALSSRSQSAAPVRTEDLSTGTAGVGLSDEIYHISVLLLQ